MAFKLEVAVVGGSNRGSKSQASGGDLGEKHFFFPLSSRLSSRANRHRPHKGQKMIIDRLSAVRGLLASFLGGAISLPCCPSESNFSSHPSPLPTAKYRVPPPGVPTMYEDNTSVFGDILRGKVPASVYAETNTLLAFRDRTPRAPLHGLVIPKRHIRSVRNLVPDDLNTVVEMKEMALGIIREEQPKAYDEEDYILCFHIAPFNSVDHLHLHVLAPSSSMDYLYRNGKYRNGTIWCTGVDDVIGRLEMGRAAV